MCLERDGARDRIEKHDAVRRVKRHIVAVARDCVDADDAGNLLQKAVAFVERRDGSAFALTAFLTALFAVSNCERSVLSWSTELPIDLSALARTCWTASRRIVQRVYDVLGRGDCALRGNRIVRRSRERGERIPEFRQKRGRRGLVIIAADNGLQILETAQKRLLRAVL